MNQTQTHTPGPWTIQTGHGNHTWMIKDPAMITRDGISAIALVPDANAYGIEDAHLIAAAPALLDALEAYMSGHVCSDKQGDQCPSLIKAREALRIARGEG